MRKSAIVQNLGRCIFGTAEKIEVGGKRTARGAKGRAYSPHLMFGFGKAAPFDREATLRRAEEFRGRKQPRQAIAELRKVLAVDPKDALAHQKLGPLLISAGKPDQALESFRIAADDLDARGFSEKALSLWLQIARSGRASRASHE